MRIFSATCVVGDGEGEVKGKTVGDVIKNLCDAKGAEFRDALYEPGSKRIAEHYAVLLNGELVDTSKELNKRVKKGDVVAILPALGYCC